MLGARTVVRSETLARSHVLTDILYKEVGVATVEQTLGERLRATKGKM